MLGHNEGTRVRDWSSSALVGQGVLSQFTGQVSCSRAGQPTDEHLLAAHVGGLLVEPPGLEPSERIDLLDSLYLSLVTVAALGYGDIVPTYAWLRLVSPLEALIGCALLTAAVSWILQIHPALARKPRWRSAWPCCGRPVLRGPCRG